MANFHGSVRLASDPESQIRATVAVKEDRLTLLAGDEELGTWHLGEINVENSGGAFLIEADGEQLILDVDEATAFGAAVTSAQPVAEPATVESPVATAPPPPVTPPQAATAVASTDGAAARVMQADPEPVMQADPEPVMQADPEPVVQADPEPEASNLDRLRQRAAASYTDDDTLKRSVGWALLGTGALLLVGSAMAWGTAQLTNSTFKVGRVLGAVGGTALVIGAYLGLWAEQRKAGSMVAAGGGILALVILFLAAREAGIGIGFMLAIVAALFGFALAITSWLDTAAAPSERKGAED